MDRLIELDSLFWEATLETLYIVAVTLGIGGLGGLLLRFETGVLVGARRYPAMPAAAEIDATGAGDTMLAGLVAARVAAGPDARARARDLHLGAMAASLLMEGPGMDSVPTFDGLRRRARRGS